MILNALTVQEWREVILVQTYPLGVTTINVSLLLSYRRQNLSTRKRVCTVRDSWQLWRDAVIVSFGDFCLHEALSKV